MKINIHIIIFFLKEIQNYKKYLLPVIPCFKLYIIFAMLKSG